MTTEGHMQNIYICIYTHTSEIAIGSKTQSVRYLNTSTLSQPLAEFLPLLLSKEKVAPFSREAHRHYWSGRFCQREPCRTSPAVSCSSSSVGSKARGTILSSGPSLFAFIWASCSGRMSLRGGGGGGGGSSVEDSLGGGGLHERMMDSRACRLSYMGLLKLVGHVGSWRDPAAPSTVT